VWAVSRACQSKNKTKEESSGPHLLLTAVRTCQPDRENSNTTDPWLSCPTTLSFLHTALASGELASHGSSPLGFQQVGTFKGPKTMMCILPTTHLPFRATSIA
jgi:hypothetical protein